MNSPELIAVSVAIAILLYVWVALALSAVFRKAGEEPWRAWVPVLNTIVVLRLGRLSGWLVLLIVVPVVGALAFFVITIIALQRINRSFGLGVGMTVLGALLFPVWASVVGWGSARWLAGAVPNAPARRRVGSEYGWQAPEPPAPTLSATPGSGAGLGSVFGTHGPAGGPELPERPPAPTTGGYPSVVPVPVGRGGAPLPVGVPAEATAPPPVPTFRSTMHETPAAFAAGPGIARRGVARDVDAAAHRPSLASEDMDDTEGARPQAQPPVSARASSQPWAPAVSDEARVTSSAPFLGSSELTYESSAEVSAVQGAPTSGAPRSARTSVSAQHRRPEIPDGEAVEESFEETIVAVRRRTVWTLVPTLGAPIPLTADVVIIGRRPHREADYGDAQLVAIQDETRTVSKTHARMELTADGWTIVDLDSTNGVILIGEDGTEKDAAAGCPEKLTARFLLGDAEFGLRREGE